MLSKLGPCVLASLSFVALSQAGDLTETLDGNKNISQFSTLLRQQYGEIYANLSYARDTTILIPNDAAFEKIPYSTLGPAFENNMSDVVRSILEYHVLPGRHSSKLFNSSFQFFPTTLVNASSTNVTGGQTVGFVKQAGDVVVLTSGLGSRSTLTENDIEYSNEDSSGLIHVIDSFLTPPANFINTCPQFNLTAFGGAVTNASKAEYMNTQKDLTIFAPNNEAIQNLGTTLSSLSVQDLGSLIDYHVVNGSRFVGYSSNLPNGTILQTRQGGKISITFAGNSIYANSAQIVQSDLLLSNGVLHVINNVLDPNSTDVKPNPAQPTQAPVLEGSSLPDNVIPFASDLPSSVSSFASSSPGADATSFGIGDIGSGATATSAAFSRSSKTSKSDGVNHRTEGLGAVLSLAMFILGYL